jgi:uncharacterized ion transporter superfamily protein YfcC
MAWFGLAKIALQAGSHIYKKRQETKMAMSDARLMHAQKMASGEESYQGKLLEARQNDYKDEFVLVIISAPIIVLAWGVFSDDPAALEKIKIFFEHFQQLPTWFSTLWILVVGSIFGIKGTQIFRNNGGKK